jgi:glycosyltransferase involved in cell wall biosynthesis
MKASPVQRGGRVTHVSLDGLSTPLGESQVLAVSERLQSMGWECTILSLEPESGDPDAFDGLDVRMASSGIRWQHRPYRRGRIGAVRNALSMTAMLRDVWERTDLVHCRSYFGAFFPAAADIFGSTPYVFDTRGYWVEEKIEAGHWFQDAASRAIARRVERELYQRASGVVSLTELAAEDVRNGRFGRRHPRERSICIPTCVDYTTFTMDRGPAPHDFLNDGPIVAYVGSLNPSYEYRKSLELVALTLSRIPQARFLALTSQVSEMRSLADEFAIPASRRLITSVAHNRIHRWLPWIDFGVTLLVNPIQAKRASMPTKLAEFFATGIAPISHGANSEVTDWVNRAGSGMVLEDLSPNSLERAADFVARGVPDADVLMRARLAAEKHFSLDSGAERYDALFRDVLAG